jgi:hypothetical protein
MDARILNLTARLFLFDMRGECGPLRNASKVFQRINLGWRIRPFHYMEKDDAGPLEKFFYSSFFDHKIALL